MLIVFGFLQIVFSRRYKGPSNNPFARHPGNAPLTRPTTRPGRGAEYAAGVLLSERGRRGRVARLQGSGATLPHVILRKMRGEVLEKISNAIGYASFFSRSHSRLR